jgi:hypothetical protein
VGIQRPVKGGQGRGGWGCEEGDHGEGAVMGREGAAPGMRWRQW